MENRATAKLVFEQRKGDKWGKKTIKLRVTFNRISHLYATASKTKITKEEWQNPKLKITKKVNDECQKSLEVALKICEELGGSFTFNQFINKYKSELYGKRYDPLSLDGIYQRYISVKDLSIKTKSSYKSSINSVNKIKPNVKIGDITPEFVLELQKRWEKDGASANTIRINMRQIKLLYNYSVGEGFVKDTQPFKNIKTSAIRSINKGLDISVFEKIVLFKSDDCAVQRSRDFFVLSFLLNGHYLSDILLLKNKIVGQNNILTFVRKKTRKTQRPINIQLVNDSINILNKYGKINPSSPEEYILPYLSGATDQNNIENRIHSFIAEINMGLKKMCKELNIPKITSRISRHSYGSIMLSLGRTKEQLQNDFGHEHIATTDGYINTLSGWTDLIKGGNLKNQFSIEEIKAKNEKGTEN